MAEHYLIRLHLINCLPYNIFDTPMRNSGGGFHNERTFNGELDTTTFS